MENKEFYLNHDGYRIHCKLDFPESMQNPDEKCPLLILVHGLNGHMEERHVLSITDQLQSLGIAVLRVELYGHGKSDGTYQTHTLLKWIDQMLTIIDYAEALPFVQELYLAGHSQGGFLTMFAGAMEQDRLKAILLLSPAILIRDCAVTGEILGAKFDAQNIPREIVMVQGKNLSGNYMRTAQLLPVEAAIQSFEKPVLIVHADTDELVPVRYSLEAAKQYKNSTLRIIKDDTHCYDHHLDEVNEAIREFITTL